MKLKDEEKEFNGKSISNSYSNLPNDLSSKTLLSNVPDIKDDFEVIGRKLNKYQKGNITHYRSRAFHDQLSGNSYQTSFLNRENSFLSQCESCGDILNRKSNVHVIRNSLNLILKELKQLTRKFKDDKADEDKELNWKFVAMVIDRLCMVLFTFATFISTILILLTSKNFFNFR